MEDENEYKKLPTEDKCVHKLWKARVAGYEEAMKLFNQIDDEKAPEWNKYLGLIKKFVTDSNAVAQEKGMEAALVFVENCGHAGKTAGEVMAGVVAKCLAAPKTKTKDLALQITLMYVEIEKHEIVEDELIKGMEQKNPKVVAACISALNTSLKLFGNKVIAIKPMVKKIPILLADRDKGVRDEMKALVVEMHRWIGVAIEPHISSLQPVVQQELKEAFSAAGSARPQRYLRSQQSRALAPQPQAMDGGDEDDEVDAAGGDSADMDPYELLDPVEILSRLPKDLYEKLEAKKWQERKEALDALENLLKTAPRLEPGDYAELVRALKKVISKDSNVMLVALGGRLLASVASGLRGKFQPYAVACTAAILEKFKEKKTNVVSALRDAIDAIYPSTNLEAIMEDMLAAFENKNPSVKSETALFLARALCVTQPAAFNKKLLKAYVAGLLKLLESAEPTVREAASEALGTATKLVGEKAIAPHIGKIDSLKEQKIKEYTDKAVIHVKVAGPRKDPKSKPPQLTAKGDTKPAAGSAQPKPVKRPTTGGAKKPLAKKAASRRVASPPREAELSPEEVDSVAEQLFSADVVKGLVDGNWKSRLQAVTQFQVTVRGLSPAEASAQLLFRALGKKPGLRDTNVQVLKARLEACKYITDNFPVSVVAADFVIHDVTAKLGEASCSATASDCLTALAEAAGLEHVLNEALGYAMDGQKNPKVQWELFNWMTNAVKEFGFTMRPTAVISHCKKALSATNPTVRTSAIAFLGVLSLYVGPSLITHLDSEKVATKQLVQAEIDKYANSTAPLPTRSVSKSASKGSMASEAEEVCSEAADEEPEPEPEVERPRTDIAPLITEALLAEVNDKNWKVRNEGLDKVKAIITNSSPIKSSLGELPAALAARLVDSNSKLAQSALGICESLAPAMGPRCKVHARTFFPAFFQALGDSKQWIRAAAVTCIEVWCREAGPAAPLDGEMVSDALKAGSPVLRAALLTWLADHLPNVPAKSFPKEELSVCVPTLFACVEDRSADVRKAASDCVLPFMLHLGYEAMHKQLDKLKPGSKSVIVAALDKARPSLPVQPLPAASGKGAPRKEPPGVKTAGAKKEADKKAVAVKGKAPAKPSSASNRGKKDDEDSTPLLPNNNSKNQRIIDDQKLKVLKWNFTTPREEFFELLKEQMTNAGCNKQLIANMFHNDFRYHLKAIEALSEDIHENGPALMSNLDLVLKWLTLRFFDTNPSVILKGLEYLSIVFQYLMDSNYTMAEYEANCFIPYLVLKVGDPKDTVRNGVKALFKQICVVYSVTKLFGYLMEGLKSKNARQRAECLECIGHLIETYGSSVMSPTGPVALKELARHIGDRDNAVRSAALNCVANAYFLEGERVYKMIGQISDKDLSLLEERIKRAGKTRSAENRRSTLVPLSASGKPLLPQPEEPECLSPLPEPEQPEEEPDELPPPPQPLPAHAPREPKTVSGPFGLDPGLIAALDAAVPAVPRLELPSLDLAFLEEPIPQPRPTPQPRHPHPLGGTVGTVGTGPQRHSVVVQSPPRASQHPAPGHADDSLLADTIHSIASPDLNAAIRALSLLSGVVVSGRGAALASHEDALAHAVARQIRRLRTGSTPPDEALPAYKYLAGALNTFYETGGCGGQVGTAALGGLLGELLRVLGEGGSPAEVDPKLARVLNNVCVRVLEHSQRTATLCAIVSLLHESIGSSDPSCPRYQDLLLKCFWKTLKMITAWEPNSFDCDAVLHKIHLFYKAYPNHFWKKNPEISDTPYRTVKTLVHTLVKMKGASITNHVTQIPDANQSDLYPYLLKVIKQLKLDDKKENSSDAINSSSVLTSVANNTALNSNRLPRAVHEELAAILKRIGTKDHNTEALTQLYDLRERHPEVDIWTFMQGSSFYFRSYVERGLREVAEQRKLGSVALFKQNYTADNVDISNENDDKSHVVFLERLRALQAKAGLKADPSSGHGQSPLSESRPLVESIHDTSLPRAHSIDPQLEMRLNQPAIQKNEAAVDALRLKLQQIKSKR